MQVRICCRCRVCCSHSLFFSPLTQLQGPTVLTCLRPPVTHTAWSTARSRWTCAATVQTADSRPRSPAHCSTTPAASAPTMRMRSGGRLEIILFSSFFFCFKASYEYLKYSFRHIFNLSSFCVLIFFILLIFQRFPTDRAYFIAKELLTTERTYVKDLEVVTVVRENRIVSPSTGTFRQTGLFHLSLIFSFRFRCMFPFPCDLISAKHVDVM